MNHQKKILVLFAHPAFESSIINKSLVGIIKKYSNITFHDLYEVYANFNIDVKHEQSLLLSHDVIVFMHPLYWYSMPSILREWQDLVLQYGFAYGSEGHSLEGKTLVSVISAGGPEESYQAGGLNGVPIKEIMTPTRLTANLTGMDYLAPFTVFGAHQIKKEISKDNKSDDLDNHSKKFEKLLQLIKDDNLDIQKAKEVRLLQDMIS